MARFELTEDDLAAIRVALHNYRDSDLALAGRLREHGMDPASWYDRAERSEIAYSKLARGRRHLLPFPDCEGPDGPTGQERQAPGNER